VKRRTASRWRTAKANNATSFARRFLLLAGPFWSSENNGKARWLAAALVTLTVAQVVIQVIISYWSANLFDALEQKGMDRFLYLVGTLGGVIVAHVVVNTTHLRVKRRLQLVWRQWLTRKLLGEWMAKGRHYQLQHLPGEHDNPDGRIAEDIRVTTEAAVELAHSLLYCVLMLGSFLKILWSLSGSPEFTIGPVTVTVPGYLVWAALLYAAFGTLVALRLGQPLVRAMYNRQTFEANFRFGLVRGREHSEEIAVVHGEQQERHRFKGLFLGVRRAWHRQTSALANILVFTSAYSVLSIAFPIAIVAPRYIMGLITLGQLMQTAQAIQQTTAALSWPIDNLSRVAEWKASVERVLGLHESLERAVTAVDDGKRTIRIATGVATRIRFRQVSVNNPDASPAILPFDAEIRQGERVLIGGDQMAAGKLFKAVAGVWPWGGGIIDLPKGADIFFLPQRPYFPVGPLRNALAYPATARTFEEAVVREALGRVGLPQLGERLHETETWEQALSVGDQQRIGFARLLLHKPKWIFIKEASDALSRRAEEDMMNMLRDDFADAAVLTISIHSGLAAFHSRKLVLERTPEGLVEVRDTTLVADPPAPAPV